MTRLGVTRLAVTPTSSALRHQFGAAIGVALLPALRSQNISTAAKTPEAAKTCVGPAGGCIGCKKKKSDLAANVKKDDMRPGDNTEVSTRDAAQYYRGHRVTTCIGIYLLYRIHSSEQQQFFSCTVLCVFSSHPF